MPLLAKHLDVGVTSIYWYFRKKDDLLNAMTEQAVEAWAQAVVPLSDVTWQEALRHHCREQRRIVGSDSTLLDLLMIRTSTYSREATRRVFEMVESVMALLVASGFSAENALR